MPSTRRLLAASVAIAAIALAGCSAFQPHEAKTVSTQPSDVPPPLPSWETSPTPGWNDPPPSTAPPTALQTAKPAVIARCKQSATDDLQMSPDILTFTHLAVTNSVVDLMDHEKNFYDVSGYVNDIDLSCVGIKVVDGQWQPGGHESVTIGGVEY